MCSPFYQLANNSSSWRPRDSTFSLRMGVLYFSRVKAKSVIEQFLENKEQYDAPQKLLNLISPQVIRNTPWSEVVKAAGRPGTSVHTEMLSHSMKAIKKPGKLTRPLH